MWRQVPREARLDRKLISVATRISQSSSLLSRDAPRRTTSTCRRREKPGEDVGGPCRRVRNTPLLTGDKDNPEARLVAHHTGVRFCSTFQGNRFDHRTNVLEDAECQGIFDVNG